MAASLASVPELQKNALSAKDSSTRRLASLTCAAPHSERDGRALGLQDFRTLEALGL